MSTWKEKLIRLNFKKIAVGFMAAVAIVAVTGAAVFFGNFRPRMEGWRSTIQDIRQEYQSSAQYQGEGSDLPDGYYYGRYGRGHMGRGHMGRSRWGMYDSPMGGASCQERMGQARALESRLGITTTDKLLVGSVMGSAALLAVALRVLLALWIAQRALKAGTNAALWGLATLVFHLGGIIAFFLYLSLRSRCGSCGKIQSKDATYCTSCGAAVTRPCSSCENPVKAEESYCSHCGQKQER